MAKIQNKWLRYIVDGAVLSILLVLVKIGLDMVLGFVTPVQSVFGLGLWGITLLGIATSAIALPVLDRVNNYYK